MSHMLFLFIISFNVEVLPKLVCSEDSVPLHAKLFEVSLENCTLVNKLKSKCIWEPMFHPQSRFTIYQIHTVQKGLLTLILCFLTYNLNTVLFHVSWVICELGEMSLLLIFLYLSWNSSALAWVAMQATVMISPLLFLAWFFPILLSPSNIHQIS